MPELDPLVRDPDRVHVQDRTIIDVYDKETDEQIAYFPFDSAVHVPEVGESLDLHRGSPDETVPESPDETGTVFDFETYGRYEVVDRTTGFTLVEWEESATDGTDTDGTDTDGTDTDGTDTEAEMDMVFTVIELTVVEADPE